jgi:hypothetical protein
VSSWVMIRTMSAMLCILVVCSEHAQAQTRDRDQVEQALRVVKELCLSGKQYDLHVDAKGNIVIKKLTPGGQGSATISQREAEESAATYDEKLRIIADLHARDCTKAHILNVLSLLEQESSNTVGSSIGKPERINLSGLWIASGYVCQYGVVIPEEKVRIQHVGNVVTAIKEKGDDCIRSGEITFTGKYDGTKPTIPVEMQMRSPNTSATPHSISALLEVVDSDSLVLVYHGVKITFERYK